MPSGRAQTNSCIQPEDPHPCPVEEQDIEHPLLINAMSCHTVCAARLELIATTALGLEL